MGKKKSSKERKLKLERNKKLNKIEKIHLSSRERDFGRVQIVIILLMIAASVAFVVTQVG